MGTRTDSCTSRGPLICPDVGPIMEEPNVFARAGMSCLLLRTHSIIPNKIKLDNPSIPEGKAASGSKSQCKEGSGFLCAYTNICINIYIYIHIHT